MEEVVLVTMEKELDEPFYICRDGKWVCIYINIETDYRVVLSEDIETGYMKNHCTGVNYIRFLRPYASA